eukprot:3932531-Rhodomonas_salina.1
MEGLGDLQVLHTYHTTILYPTTARPIPSYCIPIPHFPRYPTTALPTPSYSIPLPHTPYHHMLPTRMVMHGAETACACMVVRSRHGWG